MQKDALSRAKLSFKRANDRAIEAEDMQYKSLITP